MTLVRSLVRPLVRPLVRRLIDAGYGSVFSPLSLFAAGEQGAWYDPSDFSSMFQDSAGTTPVTATGQPVGKINDKSGRGNHATQATAASRPVLQQDAGGKYYLAFDGVDDALGFSLVGDTVSTIALGAMTNNTAVDQGAITLASQILYASLSGFIGGYNNTFLQSSYSMAAKRVAIERTRAFNDVDFFTDENAVETRTAGTAYNARTPSLGSGGGAQYLNGRIYSAIAINRVLTNAEIVSVKAHINGKTGAF